MTTVIDEKEMQEHVLCKFFLLVFRQSGDLFDITKTGDLENERFMKGMSTIPENIVWTDLTKNDSADVKAVTENDNLGNILSWKGCVSNSKEYVVSGDDEGIVRLFSFPCPESNVSSHQNSIFDAFLLVFMLF
jgi:hypothetical protein